MVSANVDLGANKRCYIFFAEALLLSPLLQSQVVFSPKHGASEGYVDLSPNCHDGFFICFGPNYDDYARSIAIS